MTVRIFKKLGNCGQRQSENTLVQMTSHSKAMISLPRVILFYFEPRKNHLYEIFHMKRKVMSSVTEQSICKETLEKPKFKHFIECFLALKQLPREKVLINLTYVETLNF